MFSNDSTLYADLSYRPQKYSSYEKDIFHRNLIELEATGYYYRGLSGNTAKTMLTGSPPGRFLIRDSSSQSCYFTMTYTDRNSSVKNIRIGYSFGSFHFATNSQPTQKASTVLGLLELYYYKEQSEDSDQLFLREPIKKGVPSLKHLCRLSLNQQNINTGNDHKHVQAYLDEYPYKL